MLFSTLYGHIDVPLAGKEFCVSLLSNEEEMLK